MTDQSSLFPAQASPAPAPNQPEGVIVPERRPNWLLAVVAAVIAGAVVAFLYALIASLINRELLFLMFFVGGAPAAMVVGLGRPRGFASRAIGMLLSVVLGAAAIAAAIVLYVAAEAAGSIGSGISNLGNINYDRLFEVYFSDPLGYVWVAAGLIIAAWIGKGSGDSAKP